MGGTTNPEHIERHRRLKKALDAALTQEQLHQRYAPRHRMSPQSEY